MNEKDNNLNDGSLENVIYDASRLEPYMRKVQIQKLLGANSIDEFSLIRWIPIGLVMPDEASYVLIKYRDRDGQTYTSMVGFERNEFWDLNAKDDLIFNKEVILGWSYLPGDDRLNALGELL